MLKKFAVIENGKVTNIALWDDEFPKTQGWIEINDENVDIDFDYVNGQFVDNRPKPIQTDTIESVAPTKEQLMAQLQAMQAQITALT